MSRYERVSDYSKTMVTLGILCMGIIFGLVGGGILSNPATTIEGIGIFLVIFGSAFTIAGVVMVCVLLANSELLIIRPKKNDE